MNEKQEYAVVNNAVSILASMCAGDTTKIIDLLTGYLWDEEEAGELKHASKQKIALCKRTPPACSSAIKTETGVYVCIDDFNLKIAKECSPGPSDCPDKRILVIVSPA